MKSFESIDFNRKFKAFHFFKEITRYKVFPSLYQSSKK